MTFPEIRASIDERLETEPRLAGSRRELQDDMSVWTRDKQAVAIAPSGSTGILVEYRSEGRPVRRKIFAASPMSVDRIVVTSAEHLTDYAFHRTMS
jgi:hypothetical protein